jgi:glycosyltransferase involved in cell wall biosynthesis
VTAFRILFFSHYFLPHVGGATWSTYYLSLSLSRRGHEIDLIVPNTQYALSVDDRTAKVLEKEIPIKLYRTPILRIPGKLAPFLSAFFLFFKGLRVGRSADVIVCQFHPHHFVFVAALLVAKIFRVPVVARANDIHREMGTKNLGFMERLINVANTFSEYFVKYAQAFLVVDSEGMEILLSRLGKSASNCYIGLSHNGVAQSVLKDAPSKEEARKLLGIETGEKVLLFVGRFSGEEYGIEALLKAMPNILTRVPNSVLILVGDKMTLHQQKLVNSLRISKNIRAYGPQRHKQIIKFVVAADLCIGPLMPTLAIPQKVLEYMACGKPVVTGIKSVSKDLNPSLNLLVVPPEPKSVAEAIVNVLQNEEYARMLGSNGKRSVGKFTWDNIGAELERLLLKILRGGI